MLAEVRRQEIVKMVRTDGEIPTDVLARRLDVSVETIRRDFRALEARGALHRVHGGAVARNASTEAPHRDRRHVAADEKRAIAASIAAQLPHDSTVFLDLGTTIDAVVEAIPDTFRGTLITTSLRAASHLARLDDAEIIVAGGRLRKDELSTTGGLTQDILREIHPDIAVISTGAISTDHGITDFNFHDIGVKRTVIHNAASVFVVADSTKFGTTATYRICPIADPDHLVTTTRLADHHRSAITEAGGRLILANAHG